MTTTIVFIRSSMLSTEQYYFNSTAPILLVVIDNSLNMSITVCITYEHHRSTTASHIRIAFILREIRESIGSFITVTRDDAFEMLRIDISRVVKHVACARQCITLNRCPILIGGLILSQTSAIQIHLKTILVWVRKLYHY